MGFIVLISNKVSYWCIMHLKMEFELNWSSFNSGFKTNRFPVFIKFQNGNNSVFFKFITRSFWCIWNAFRNFLTDLNRDSGWKNSSRVRLEFYRFIENVSL